jgi:hypothetical protein
MSCSSIKLNGIGLGCKDSMGGIKKVYIAKFEDVSLMGITDNMIDDISMKNSATFKTYEFRKGTSSMSTTLTTDEAAGTLSFQTDVSLQFSKMDTSKRLEIMALCVDSVVVIVEDSNGKCWYLGYDFPVTATTATANTGTSFGDFSGYNITLTDNSKELPYEVSYGILNEIVETPPVV